MPGVMARRRGRCVGEVGWNAEPERVTVPYPTRGAAGLSTTQVPRDTRNPVGIREDHLLRLITLIHR